MAFATFNRFEIEMTWDQAVSASHPGRCDEDVAILVNDPKIADQLDDIGAYPIRMELSEYGAWSAKELEDDEQNQNRIVWLAAGDIAEQSSREAA